MKVGSFKSFMYKTFKRKKLSAVVPDFGVWNINAIEEMKKFTDRAEIHVIAPYPYLEHKVFEYEEEGINYHFFRSTVPLMVYLINHFLFLYDICKPSYKKNRGIIKNLIKKIQPSIVHLVGAENPYYSLAGVDVPKEIKLIVQLQTMMSDPNFFENYPIDKRTYNYRAGVEKAVIKRADYIGTPIKDYRDVILEYINQDAKFLDIKLAVAENIRTVATGKEYDFVYFARSISKAGDWAVKSFIEASKMKPGITMLVIGGYSLGDKEQYEELLAENGLSDKVTFTGELPTHDDVLDSVSKARIALLPLKFDFISGTIREANALGLPVVTSITDGTPSINEKRRCVLLSAAGDHKSMADNMIRVLEDRNLAEELVQNSYIRLQETYNNTAVVEKWLDVYDDVLSDSYKL